LRFPIGALLIALLLPLQAGAADAPVQAAPVAPKAIAAVDHDAWTTEIAGALQQIDLLELFGQITQLHPISVSVPEQLQRVPLEKNPETQKLAEKIEIRIKKLYFDKLSFARPEETLWSADHPLLATLVDFAEIRVNAEAKTPVGVVPLEGFFTGGRLPADFDIFRDRLELHPTPARRQNEGKIDGVKITSKTPLVGPLLTKLAAPELAKAILNAGVGKTLTMKKGQLLGSEGGGGALDSILPLLDKGGKSGEGGKGGIGGLLEKLRK